MMIILIHISPLKRTISLISYINIALQIWYRRELEDSKILGIKFDSICLTIISPKKSLSHSILASGCVAVSYSGDDTTTSRN
jgi:hypothetical protein